MLIVCESYTASFTITMICHDGQHCLAWCDRAQHATGSDMLLGRMLSAGAVLPSLAFAPDGQAGGKAASKRKRAFYGGRLLIGVRQHRRVVGIASRWTSSEPAISPRLPIPASISLFCHLIFCVGVPNVIAGGFLYITRWCAVEFPAFQPPHSFPHHAGCSSNFSHYFFGYR